VYVFVSICALVCQPRFVGGFLAQCKKATTKVQES